MRAGVAGISARAFSTKANNAPSSAARCLPRQSFPPYWAIVACACRARFHVQRASSTNHDAVNMIASAAAASAMPCAGRNRRHSIVTDAASAIATASSKGSGSGLHVVAAHDRVDRRAFPALECEPFTRAILQDPGGPRGFCRDAGNPERLRYRAANRETDAGDAPEPARVVGDDHREQSTGLDGDRDAENLARRVIRPPDKTDVGARRHVVRIPCDHRIVARAQVGGRGDIDLARRIAAGDNEFVVDYPAHASGQRQVPHAPLLDGRRRKPARRHRERQVGEHDDNQRRGERQQRSRRSRLDIAGGQCALRLVSMCQRVRQRMRRSNRSDQLSM